MKKVRAKQLLVLDAGTVVQLDAKQAGDRGRRVTKVGGDRYKLNEPLQFKAGEVFGLDGDLPKGCADQLELMDSKKAEEPAKDETAKTEGKAGGLFSGAKK